MTPDNEKSKAQERLEALLMQGIQSSKPTKLRGSKEGDWVYTGPMPGAKMEILANRNVPNAGVLVTGRSGH